MAGREGQEGRKEAQRYPVASLAADLLRNCYVDYLVLRAGQAAAAACQALAAAHYAQTQEVGDWE